MPEKELTELEEKLIRKLYLQLMSVHLVKKHTGVSLGLIKKALNKKNIRVFG
jgi:DNA invertase Pin-like site-specific DNA recombinase